MYLLNCFLVCRSARSCRHVTRTPLTATSYSMMSTTLSPSVVPATSQYTGEPTLNYPMYMYIHVCMV